GVAIVKVGGSEDSIRAAAQRFLMQQDGIVGFTQEVLSGALRAIVGRMSVEDVIRDRAAFAGQVAEEAEASLSGQGLVLDAFQIQDITTEGSYLEDLGRPEA
ncbi:flotillin family protein, partial [Streptomyces neyagawaensis]